MSALTEKFKLNRYKTVPIFNLPEYLKAEFSTLIDTEIQPSREVILVFTLSNEDFFRTLEALIRKDPVNDGGVILICYPKKGSPDYPSFVHRDEIFPKVKMDDDGFIFGSPYKFNRMLGFDDNFTLLEVKKVLNFKPGSRPSRSGSDFVGMIPQIEALLKDEPVALAFYQSLTPGYRKDWAVYCFSTESLATRQKRIEEMIRLLKMGHKNMTLYRQSLKK